MVNIVCLAGGVGAARFLQGVLRVVPSKDVAVISNTGDDMNLYGLHISPDIDIVTYTLAGIVDDEKGWGIKGDTFNFLEQMRGLGHDTWFNIGDRDLATHVNRTMLLKQGFSLSEVTKAHCEAFGVKTRILPMTDDKFETHIETETGLIHFEEYLVKRGAIDPVLGVRYIGSESAEPAPGVIEVIKEAKVVLLAPSNPIVSLGTILSVKGIRDALKETEAKVVGISPIVGGLPVKGPADKLMSGLGIDVNASSVAKLFVDFLDRFVIDDVDKSESEKIEEMGIEVSVTNTIMKSLEDKVSLAKETLQGLTVK